MEYFDFFLKITISLLSFRLTSDLDKSSFYPSELNFFFKLFIGFISIKFNFLFFISLISFIITSGISTSFVLAKETKIGSKLYSCFIFIGLSAFDFYFNFSFSFLIYFKLSIAYKISLIFSLIILKSNL